MNVYSTYSDDKLLELLREGDRTAFEEIYFRYLLSLYDVTYKRLKQREQTEDVLQEVFARIWLKRKSLSTSNLFAYLYTAVRNETINYITRNKNIFEFYKPFESVLLEPHNAEDQLSAKGPLSLVYSYVNTE